MGKSILVGMTVQLIVSMPTWIEAKLWEIQGRRFLDVYASPVVEETDECWVPIRKLLDGTCVKTLIHSVVDDDTMIFEEGIRSLYRLYRICPGFGVMHECTYDRKELAEGGIIYGQPQIG